MNGRGARRPFWFALAFSLCLHLAVALSPGWELPRENEAPTLEATLVLPPAAPRAPAPRSVAPRPAPKPPTAPRSIEPVAAAPTPPPAPAPEPAPAPAPAEEAVPPAPTAGAVPPAPTIEAPAPVLTGRLPAAGRIVYRVARGDGFVVGESEQRWHHDGQHYELRAESGTTGLVALFKPVKVVQESRGVFDQDGLRPLEFERRQGDKLKERIRFLPEEGTTEINGQRTEFIPGAQDLLSIFYQLGVLAANVPRFDVAVAAGRRIVPYTVTVGEVGPLELPQGVRAARAYTLIGGQEETIAWLDADTLLPIKIRHKDKKGEVFEQLATLIELE